MTQDTAAFEGNFVTAVSETADAQKKSVVSDTSDAGSAVPWTLLIYVLVRISLLSYLSGYDTGAHMESILEKNHRLKI
jgi:hypothetical protein